MSIRRTPVRRVSVKVLRTWPSAGGAVGKEGCGFFRKQSDIGERAVGIGLEVL